MDICIQICNWLLTRRCNLRCDYCRLVRDYEDKPPEYPGMKYYYENELDPSNIIEALSRLKRHNPNMFHVLYGGEPTLYEGLEDIISFCNEEDIPYTIITNSSQMARERIRLLVKKVGRLRGLTASIDPVLFIQEQSDIKKKSEYGLEHLLSYRDKVHDLVAEITCTSKNIKYLVPLVTSLTKKGIWSSITMIELSTSKYYDFSNCTDKSLWVKKLMVYDTLMLLKHGPYKIHMKESLIPILYKHLPQHYDCKIGKIPYHNLTIDSDGRPRLCLRIRGLEAPKLKLLDYLDTDGTFSNEFISNMVQDYQSLCRRCIWTCPMMSEITLRDKDSVRLLHH